MNYSQQNLLNHNRMVGNHPTTKSEQITGSRYKVWLSSRSNQWCCYVQSLKISFLSREFWSTYKHCIIIWNVKKLDGKNGEIFSMCLELGRGCQNKVSFISSYVMPFIMLLLLLISWKLDEDLKSILERRCEDKAEQEVSGQFLISFQMRRML